MQGAICLFFRACAFSCARRRLGDVMHLAWKLFALPPLDLVKRIAPCPLSALHIFLVHSDSYTLYGILFVKDTRFFKTHDYT